MLPFKLFTTILRVIITDDQTKYMKTNNENYFLSVRIACKIKIFNMCEGEPINNLQQTNHCDKS